MSGITMRFVAVGIRVTSRSTRKMCAGCLRLWYGDHAGVFDKISCEKGDRYGDDG